MYWSSVPYLSKIYSFYYLLISRENEYSILSVGNQVMSGCNHEDAGTCLVLYGF